MTERNLGEETFYFILYLVGDSLSLREIMEGTKDRILVAGTGEQDMGKWIARPTFLSTQDHLPRGWYYSQLTGPSCVNHHQSRKFPTGLPMGNLLEACSQFRFIPDNSSLCQVDNKTQTSKQNPTRHRHIHPWGRTGRSEVTSHRR